MPFSFIEETWHMSSFSRFLKELPFLPKHFRVKPEESGVHNTGGADLTGITINVYELELNDDGADLSRDTDSDQATSFCPTPKPDDVSERMLSSATTSRMGTASTQPLRYANVVVFCRKCRNEIPVRYLIRHRRRHEAFDILKYSPDFPPKTMRGLLRRRNKTIADVLERQDLDQAQIFYFTQKINIAFEILKFEVEGTEEHVINTLRWREKDIRTEGKAFSSGLLLGISKHRTPERGVAITKTVHVDNFLGNRGQFFGVYQGYNGSYVTNLCARELHRDIRENLQQHFSENGHNSEIIKLAFQEAYRRIDRIQLLGEGEHPWKRWSGCSAVTCLLLDESLYVANEGNVRGFLVRGNNAIRGITSSHDLYNRKERLRVRRNCGVIVKTERCALVNGVLDTTRGLGNQGDWRLKICVINKPKFRVVSLEPTDKMIVLASEGIWKVFSYEDVLFLLRKFLRDASSKRQNSQEGLLTSNTPEGLGFLEIPSVHLDSEYRAYLRKQNVNPIDERVPRMVRWNPDNPTKVIKRASILPEEPHLEEDKTPKNSKKCYFSESEQDDEDLQELSRLFMHYNTDSSYTRREIARLLSKRLLKSALLSGVENENVAVVLLMKGFDAEEQKDKDIPT